MCRADKDVSGRKWSVAHDLTVFLNIRRQIFLETIFRNVLKTKGLYGPETHVFALRPGAVAIHHINADKIRITKAVLLRTCSRTFGVVWRIMYCVYA